MTDLQREAEVFGKYILGTKINTVAIDRYALGMQKIGISKEDRITKKAIKYPFLLPYFDAGLALLNKKHLLQKKLLVMFSILETMPDYHSFFIAKKRSPLYIFIIFL